MSPLYLAVPVRCLGFTLHGAVLGSTVGTCYASALEGFRCEGELVS